MGYTAQSRARDERANPRAARPPLTIQWAVHEAEVLEARRTAFAQGKAAVSPEAAVVELNIMDVPEVVEALDKAGALLVKSDAVLSKVDAELDKANAEIESLKAEVATLTEDVAAATAMLEEVAADDAADPEADNPTDSEPAEGPAPDGDAPSAQTESEDAPKASAEDEPDTKPQGKAKGGKKK